jgi:hypothetical protein
VDEPLSVDRERDTVQVKWERAVLWQGGRRDCETYMCDGMLVA